GLGGSVLRGGRPGGGGGCVPGRVRLGMLVRSPRLIAAGRQRKVLVVHGAHVITVSEELLGHALDVCWTTSTRRPCALSASAAGRASGARVRASAPSAAAAVAMSAPCGVVKKRRSRAGGAAACSRPEKMRPPPSSTTTRS